MLKFVEPSNSHTVIDLKEKRSVGVVLLLLLVPRCSCRWLLLYNGASLLSWSCGARAECVWVETRS